MTNHQNALEKAVEWLAHYLADAGGRVEAGPAQAAARAAGINERTLSRARVELGLSKHKTGFQGTWEWYPPDGATTAVEWLADYLKNTGGQAEAGLVLAAGRAAGHSERTLRRARVKLGLGTRKTGWQGTWDWYLPPPTAHHQPPTQSPTSTTVTECGSRQEQQL